jgi:hypothetical protein
MSVSLASLIASVRPVKRREAEALRRAERVASNVLEHGAVLYYDLKGKMISCTPDVMSRGARREFDDMTKALKKVPELPEEDEHAGSKHVVDLVLVAFDAKVEAAYLLG